MKKDKEPSVFINAIFNFLKAFFTLVFPLISFPYASRILHPSGIGKVNFSSSIISYFIVIAELGIAKYAIREIPKYKNNRNELSKFTKELYIISSVSCLISYCLFLLLLFFSHKLYDYRTILLICSTKIFFDTLGIEWFYNGLEKFKYISIRSFIFQILSLVFLFSFVKTEKDLIQYAVFGLILGTLSNITNIVLLHKYVDFNIKCSLEIKKHFKYIFYFFGMTVVTSLYEILDTSMLGLLSTDEQVGLYSAGVKINRMSVEVLTAITAVFLPRLSEYFNNNDNEKFETLIKQGISIIFILGFPIMAGLYLLSTPLINVFCGKTFAGAVLPMKIISPVILFISVSNLLSGQILPAMKKEKYSIRIYIAAAVTNISCNLFLIPKYGATGAGIATVFAEFVAFILPCIILRKYMLCKEQFINLIQVIISTAIMLVAIIFLLWYIDDDILEIILIIIVSVMVYGMCLFLSGNIFLKSVIKRILKK